MGRWLVKITLLNEPEPKPRMSLEKIEILGEAESLKVIEELLEKRTLRYRMLRDRKRTYYHDGIHTIKIRWFENDSFRLPPVAEIYTWLQTTFIKVRGINHDAEEV